MIRSCEISLYRAGTVSAKHQHPEQFTPQYIPQRSATVLVYILIRPAVPGMVHRQSNDARHDNKTATITRCGYVVEYMISRLPRRRRGSRPSLTRVWLSAVVIKCCACDRIVNHLPGEEHVMSLGTDRSLLLIMTLAVSSTSDKNILYARRLVVYRNQRRWWCKKQGNKDCD